MVETTYREAVKAAITDAMTRDDRVFLMGEDVGHYGGCYAVSKGLLDKFGPDRIRDTPLSESGFTGAGIGAAIAGMRPIVEVMTVNFSLACAGSDHEHRRHLAAYVQQPVRRAGGDPHGDGCGQTTGRAAFAFSWKAGMHIFRACGCWPRPRWRTRAACSGPRCKTPTRC